MTKSVVKSVYLSHTLIEFADPLIVEHEGEKVGSEVIEKMLREAFFTLNPDKMIHVRVDQVVAKTEPHYEEKTK